VINAAAFTVVDQAEESPDAAFAVNRDGAAALAQACAARSVPLIHLSTDYVFDGVRFGAYRESDPAQPLNVYGRSKLEGEAAIRAVHARHVILRCSWVFGPHRHNFVRSIIARASQGDRLRVVNDQRGCPTATSLLADAMFVIIQRIVAGGDVPWGLYHYAGREPVTWFEFAQAIVAAARPWLQHVPDVEPITSAEFPVRARRPSHSVLDCSLIAERFGVIAGSWRGPLAETVARLVQADAASSGRAIGRD
jgi:dTDP-4-dehydrorhamnose reductase